MFSDTILRPVRASAPASQPAVVHAVSYINAVIFVKIIGINNRNLQTFETDVHTSLALSEHFQEKPVYISESAILTKTDAALVAPFFNGILVGRALMQAENVAEKVKELQIDKG